MPRGRRGGATNPHTSTKGKATGGNWRPDNPDNAVLDPKRAGTGTAFRERKQRNKASDFTSIKCRLKPRWMPGIKHPGLRAFYMDWTEKHVQLISQVTVRGTSMTNSILVHCFRNNIGLPELTQTFFCACFHSFRSDYNLRNPKLASIIETVTAAEYASFPDITAGFEGSELRGISQAVTLAALQYETNVKHDVRATYLKVQWDHIKVKLQELEKSEATRQRRRPREIKYREIGIVQELINRTMVFA